MDVDVNLLAVLVSAIASIVLGMIWYNPNVFGKMWMELAGLSDDDVKEAGPAYAINFVTALILAFSLAYFISELGYTELKDSLTFGFLAWLGFAFTTNSTSYVWGGKGGMKLFALNIGYYLVSFLVTCTIVTLWE